MTATTKLNWSDVPRMAALGAVIKMMEQSDFCVLVEKSEDEFTYVKGYKKTVHVVTVKLQLRNTGAAIVSDWSLAMHEAIQPVITWLRTFDED